MSSARPRVQSPEDQDRHRRDERGTGADVAGNDLAASASPLAIGGHDWNDREDRQRQDAHDVLFTFEAGVANLQEGDQQEPEAEPGPSARSDEREALRLVEGLFGQRRGIQDLELL